MMGTQEERDVLLKLAGCSLTGATPTPPALCVSYFFFNETATTKIYTTEGTLSLHDALPICEVIFIILKDLVELVYLFWRSKNFRSEEHTSELQSPSVISYAVFCLKKKK